MTGSMPVAAPVESNSRSPGYHLEILLISFAALLLEISYTRIVSFKRRVSCRKTEVVTRFKPKADGTFTVGRPAPEGQLAAVYRMETAVRKTTRNPKTYPTFTLPRYVDLG